MRYSIGSLILLVFATGVSAQGDYLLEIFNDDKCEGDDKFGLHTFDPNQDGCLGGNVIPDDKWERDEKGFWRGYMNANGLDPNCKIAILEQSAVDPTKCGVVTLVIDGALDHACGGFWFPEYFATKYCCGAEACNKLGVNVKRRSGLGVNLQQTGDAILARDMAIIKRKNPLTDRADCVWKGSAPFFRRSPDAQKMTINLPCGPDEDCTHTSSFDVTTSSTQSFGISTEVGGTFFEVIQASISFSYEYSFTQGETRSVSYTVTQPKGSNGYISWTPYYECTSGHFEGDCSGWQAGQEGEACIPKQLAGGQPDGEVRFVETF